MNHLYLLCLTLKIILKFLLCPQGSWCLGPFLSISLSCSSVIAPFSHYGPQASNSHSCLRKCALTLQSVHPKLPSSDHHSMDSINSYWCRNDESPAFVIGCLCPTQILGGPGCFTDDSTHLPPSQEDWARETGEVSPRGTCEWCSTTRIGQLRSHAGRLQGAWTALEHKSLTPLHKSLTPLPRVRTEPLVQPLHGVRLRLDLPWSHMSLSLLLHILPSQVSPKALPSQITCTRIPASGFTTGQPELRHTHKDLKVYFQEK